MKDTEKIKMQELMLYLNRDFVAWKEAYKQNQQAEGKLVWVEPTEKDYCTQRLNISYESFNRWKNMRNPISDINVLRLAITLRDTEPLRIWGFSAVPEDLWDILVRLPETAPEERARIMKILSAGEESGNALVGSWA
jgi:hypothetical protein